ncbi:Dicer-like protein 1 [Podochytrium sp. JEL0797]|nr:Dicer-like protein 1 [Podochytrium sp. JEL0797]
MYQTGVTEVHKGESQDAHLIPQFCTPHPIRASLISKSALYIPMLLQYLYHRLCTLDIQKALGFVSIAPPILFQTAFISTAAQFLPRSYERLEFLGDAYLKMHLTIHLFVNNPLRDEGWLTRSRTALERNSNLMSASLAFRLPGALLSSAISRKTWYPPQRIPRPNRVSDKATADIVEAILGVCIEASGIEGGGIALNRFFGHTYRTKVVEYASKMPYSMSAATSALGLAEEEVVNGVEVLVTKLHEKLGYRFKNPLIAVEAVTHTSALGVYDTLTSCFQRLEFLGDAILGFVVGNELYNYPENYNPGQLSTLKDEMVSNQYLAVAAQRIGLHSLIKQASSPLSQDICDFSTQLDEARRNAKPGEFFWHNMPHAPKSISDVLEALIGAVFVDSGCDYEVAKALVERVVIHDWFEVFMEAGASISGVLNPSRDIIDYAESCGCDAFFVRMTDVASEGFSICTIEKHGVVLASAKAPSKGLSRRMAIVAVMPKLKAMTESGDPNCDCAERRKQGLSTVALNVFSDKDLRMDPDLVVALEVANAKKDEEDRKARGKSAAVVTVSLGIEEVVLSDSEGEGESEDDDVEII